MINVPSPSVVRKKPDLAEFVARENSKVRETFEVADEVYRLLRSLYYAQLSQRDRIDDQVQGPVEWVPISRQ